MSNTRSAILTAAAAISMAMTGCAPLKHWWHNDFKVGPNYCRPGAPVADQYRDSPAESIQPEVAVEAQWWHVFQDPELDRLIQQAYDQNLTLKAAAWRITEARAIRRIAAASLLPQSQTAYGQYAHTQNSRNAGAAFPGLPITIDDWTTGLDVGWELDVWGRIRRNVTAADAQVLAAVKDYDFAVVSLLGEVASAYIQIRSIDERLELARKNVKLQEGSLDIATVRFNEGREPKLDVVQADSNLAATQALIPQLELARRQAHNALALLLGIPAPDFEVLPPGKIPVIPTELLVGIPAELLMRRPDIQSAERLMAAQFEQIGIAHADLYPTFSLSGTLGLQSAQLSSLFNGQSFAGTIAPAFRWNVLNYGRLRDAIRVEEARFQQIKWDFQNKVLDAQREVEDGIAEFIKLNEQYIFTSKQADANDEAVELSLALYKEGKQDFGRVFVVQSTLVQAQDQVVTLKGNIAQSVIKTYKALGGGWEVRMSGGPQVSFEEFFPDGVVPSDLPIMPEDIDALGTVEAAEPLEAEVLSSDQTVVEGS